MVNDSVRVVAKMNAMDEASPQKKENRGKSRPEQEFEPRPLDRLAYSPAEFAGLFDHAAVWGYRRIYDGDVKVLRQGGRLLIPRAEIERFLASVTTYDGMRKKNRRTAKEGC